jgi:hypothetical protein
MLEKFAPKMSSARGSEIFKSVDTLGLGKVTKLQFQTFALKNSP